MNHARSFFCIHVGLLCLALQLPHPAAAYEQIDLQGVWESNSLASGDGAPWWERARITIAADGSFTGSTVQSDGGGGPISGTFSISPDGVVTLGTARGVLDADKTVMVVTDTWSSGSPGTTEMKVFVKMAGTYGLSDLPGDWEMNAIASGPNAPWWMRGRLTVAADGSYSGTLVDSQGQSRSQVSTFSISPSGVVTIAASSTGSGVMDEGKSVLVLTSTWEGGNPGTTDLSVSLKMAGTYSLEDLVGSWEVNSLATGPGAPWWERARITVEADGSFAGGTVKSDGGGGPISGTISISPDGVVTLAGSDTARGVLDADKTVMVLTDTWSTGSPGTTEMKVALKMSDDTPVTAEAIPTAFSLRQNYPNPFNPSTTISYWLRNAGDAELVVFDLAGRRVQTLVSGYVEAGPHEAQWDGRDDQGRQVASGVYLYRLVAGEFSEIKRMVLLK
jgi:hypothetical protein